MRQRCIGAQRIGIAIDSHLQRLTFENCCRSGNGWRGVSRRKCVDYRHTGNRRSVHRNCIGINAGFTGNTYFNIITTSTQRIGCQRPDACCCIVEQRTSSIAKGIDRRTNLHGKGLSSQNSRCTRKLRCCIVRGNRVNRWYCRHRGKDYQLTCGGICTDKRCSIIYLRRHVVRTCRKLIIRRNGQAPDS